MTNRKVVSLIRTGLKEHTDDSRYTDEYLYTLALTAKNDILDSISEKKKKELLNNPFTSETFCVELEEAKAHDCDCVAIGCKVMKSVHTLPPTLTGKVMVRTLNNEDIEIIQPTVQQYTSSHPILGNQQKASIINSKVVLWNNLNLRVLLVEGVWEDSTEWIGKQFCDDSTTEVDMVCYDDPLDLEFLLPAGYVFRCIQAVVKTVLTPIQLKSDETNDSRPTK